MAMGLFGALGIEPFPSYGGALSGDYLDTRTAAVWEKGRPLVGHDPRYVRIDAFGHITHRHEHGNRSSPFGWEVDHIVPKALGGSDDLGNLRPLNCRRNAQLGGLLSGFLKSD
jgi:hypothetical protein